MAESSTRPLEAPPTTRSTVDIQVLGAGAWGSAAALSLAERGHDVSLVDPAPGSGATPKAAGIVSALTWDAREYRLIAETRGAVGELIALAMCEGAMHVRGAWRPEESLLVGAADQITGVQRLVEAQGEETERLDVRSASRAYPTLEFDPQEEVLVAQEDGTVDTGLMMEALATRLAGEGVRTVREPLAAEATVVAAGAWSRSLLERRGARLPLQAFRTQLCVLEMAGEIPIVHDLRRGFYARPESEGSILAGDGTRLIPHDPDDYDHATDTMFRDHIAQAVSARFRDGAQARWRTGWAGLCVATPDRHPLCGAVPGHEGLFVLSGDNGFGIMRALALGERLADAVDGAREPWLDPGRFGDAHLDGFPMREGFADLGP